jgi:hypothetical protein
MNSDAAVAFMDRLLKTATVGGMRWGTALMQCQQWALSQSPIGFNADLGRTEQLFGDPAMQVFSTGSSAQSNTRKPAAQSGF